MKEIGKEVAIGAGHGVVPFEEACGRGSYPGFNEEYCAELLRALDEFNVTSVHDYGCGNLECYRGRVDWETLPVSYTGFDAHAGCVEEVRSRYPRLDIRELPLGTFPEDKADAVIIKDVLIHWFDPRIKWFFREARRRYRVIIYCHSTSGFGYKAKHNRHAPHPDYKVEADTEWFFGNKSVPREILPRNIAYHKNLRCDAMKTFIVFA